MGHTAPSLAVELSGYTFSLGVSIIQVLYFYIIFEGVILGDAFCDCFLRGSKNLFRGFRGVMSKLLLTRISEGGK